MKSDQLSTINTLLSCVLYIAIYCFCKNISNFFNFCEHVIIVLDFESGHQSITQNSQAIRSANINKNKTYTAIKHS